LGTHPISDDVQNTLLAKLKSTVGLEQIELTTEIDENLIGGYILHWDDKMIDNSISRGLAILKDEFDNNDYVRKF
jgi:F-type H+-transporting ATPase subunit delta